MHLGCTVDARQRWQALQTNLTRSRARLDAGDFAAALAAVDAALAIDPDFLAAQSLRIRIVSVAPNLSIADAYGPPRSAVSANLAADVAASNAAEAASFDVPLVAQESKPPDEPNTVAAVDADTLKVDANTPEVPHDLPLTPPVIEAPASRPPVSTEGYAQFEQRAKRRRADRRLDAARAALAHGRVKEAAAALDEVIELDPNLPELRELTVRYHALRRASRRPRPRAGRWLAAAAAFGGVLLGASWLQDTTGLWSRQTVGVSSLVAPPEPFGVTVSASETAAEPALPVATSGGTKVPARFVPDRPAPEPRETPAVERAADIRPAEPRPYENIAIQPQAPSPAPVLRAVPESAAPIAPVSGAVNTPLPPPEPPAATPTAAVVRAPDDELLINQVLQRYRSAYEGLDARSAHVVWPAVNETALARAFDGLESQKLIFDACDVRLRGEAAAATCRGSARYVPKVGSREPRVEPRTWNFTLRKDGTDWKIQSARAGR